MGPLFPQCYILCPGQKKRIKPRFFIISLMYWFMGYKPLSPTTKSWCFHCQNVASLHNYYCGLVHISNYTNLVQSECIFFSSFSSESGLLLYGCSRRRGHPPINQSSLPLLRSIDLYHRELERETKSQGQQVREDPSEWGEQCHHATDLAP